MSALVIASGKPMNQTSGNAHQVPVPWASPTPQVVKVAIVTPITAATPSIDMVRKTNLADGCTVSLRWRDVFWTKAVWYNPTISSLDCHTFKNRICLKWGKVCLPNVEFIELSGCVRIENDIHWDAVEIDVLRLNKAAA